jgi:Tfp pilus assembly protein PilN
MIKVNLLNSAVEATNLDAVESVISNRGTQQTLLLLIALGACLLGIGTDFFITRQDNSKVKTEVEAEQVRNDQLSAITKQVTEIQAKNKLVEDRINAIMRLRADQTGPLRLLQLMDGKIPDDKMFRLTSIKQEASTDKGNGITIAGYSTNEAQVTAFAKNIEFADGWFTNFSVETSRLANPENTDAGKGATAPAATAKGAAPVADAKTKAPALPKEIVQFTIHCKYDPQNLLVNPGSAQPNGSQPAPSPSPNANAPKVQ